MLHIMLQVRCLFEEMAASNLAPTLISYNTLLHSLARCGGWQDASLLIAHMCSAG